MGRIMAIDYGLKRVGIAVTDPMKIIASPLTTIAADQLLDYIKDYSEREDLEELVIGWPMGLNNMETDSTRAVQSIVAKIRNKFPDLKVQTIDERFTSKIATEAIRASGARKKQRRDKKLIDKVSASLILQTYLGN